MPVNLRDANRAIGLRAGAMRGSRRPARDISHRPSSPRLQATAETDGGASWFLMRLIASLGPPRKLSRPGPGLPPTDGPDPQTNGFTLVNGAPIEWSWVGPAPEEAPTLVFLHEALGCVDAWREFPANLAARLGFGALSYSRAGFGRSGPGVLPLPLDYHRREALDGLPQMLDQAGIRRAVLVGHSDGGTMALLRAGTAQDPRVCALVTIAAHVFNEDVTIDGIEAAKRNYHAEFKPRLLRYHGNKASAVFWGWSDIWLSPAFRSWTITRALAGITQPLLAVQGADDRYGTLAQLNTIVEQVAGPAARLVIPACGHVPHLEKKEELIDAIAGFLGGLKLGWQ